MTISRFKVGDVVSVTSDQIRSVIKVMLINPGNISSTQKWYKDAFKWQVLYKLDEEYTKEYRTDTLILQRDLSELVTPIPFLNIKNIK